MRGRESAAQRSRRVPLASWAAAARPPCIGPATFFLVVFLVLALAAPANAYIYWANRGGGVPGTGTIGRANLDGTEVDQKFIARAGEPCAVAIDDAHVYWDNSSAGTIGRADLDGSGANLGFITGASFPCGVAVDSAHVYWANGFGEAIGRANLDGRGTDQSFITDAYFPRGVAVDGAHVYWANAFSRGDPLGGGTIGRANLDGSGAEQSFIPGGGGLCGVAVDGTHVYWANFAGGTIGRANLDGTGIDQSFIMAPADPCGVAVDNEHVYWGTPSGGTVARANLDGTEVDQSFITGADFPFGVAVDPPNPSDDFNFGRVKKNKRKGTAKLTVKVPGPGELRLAKNRQLKGTEKGADAAGNVKLPIKPRRKAKKKLAATGKAMVKAKVTYTPNGGEPNTQSKKIKLVKRR